MKYLKIFENFGDDKDVKNYDFKDLPEKVFFNGVEYKGVAGFINGYNGYEKTEDDSFLCAIINDSAFGENQPNYLKDENGNLIHSENRRGQTVNFI